ncbi:MAG: hypothetical protein K2X34_07275, partial [Hyphomonadaceae bacterium]|nr:hypothetical protein [Hyphomonadaceae bacterium]
MGDDFGLDPRVNFGLDLFDRCLDPRIVAAVALATFRTRRERLQVGADEIEPLAAVNFINAAAATAATAAPLAVAATIVAVVAALAAFAARGNGLDCRLAVLTGLTSLARLSIFAAAAAASAATPPAAALFVAFAFGDDAA